MSQKGLSDLPKAGWGVNGAGLWSPAVCLQGDYKVCPSPLFGRWEPSTLRGTSASWVLTAPCVLGGRGMEMDPPKGSHVTLCLAQSGWSGNIS